MIFSGLSEGNDWVNLLMSLKVDDLTLGSSLNTKGLFDNDDSLRNRSSMQIDCILTSRGEPINEICQSKRIIIEKTC